ncbi:MAG: hypothetical protein ACYDHU_11545 [Acidimicrobiales bacterium]
MKHTRRWRAAPIAAAAMVALLFAGCTSVRNDLGPSSSVCYGSLPVATGAVHGRGRLDGVRLVTVSSLKTKAPHLYGAAVSRRAGAVSRVCLVAFSGRFQADGVSRPIGHDHGRLAVVELAYPGDQLLATLLVARPPLSFGHTHLGVP